MRDFTSKPSPVMVAFLFLVVCLCWGTTWLGIKIAVESIPPLTASGLRFIFAFPLFLAFARIKKEPVLYPAGRLGFFLFVMISYFTIPYYLLNYGEIFVSSGLTALIFSCMPIFILIFSAIFLRQKVYVSQVFGIIVGVFSLYLIIKAEGFDFGHSGFVGVLAILLAAIIHGFCYVFTKKYGSDIGVVTYNTLPLGGAGVILFVLGLVFEKPDFGLFSSTSWLAIVYLGVFASVGGFVVYFFLLKIMNPVVLSFVFIIFPVFSVVIGSWYEGISISSDFLTYMLVLLFGFSCTKFPLEKFFSMKNK